MKKVVVRISGGLGNQLFEYAVGCAMAERTGRALRFDLTDFIIFMNGRPYQLNHFAGPSRVPHWNRLRSALFLAGWAVNKRIGGPLFRGLLQAMEIRIVQSEKIFEFDDMFVDERFANATELLYVVGCYGHVPYLPDVERLRKDFQLVREPSEGNRAYLAQASMSDSVSIHIRRSDYLGVANGSIVLDFDYYQQAIRLVRERVKKPKWVVFSDDIPWCRSQFAFLEAPVFVAGNEQEPWEDLRLMWACRHHIIANSTFSWWGAYLGCDTRGVTVYPDYWFPTLRTCPTMVPADWTPAPAFVGRRCAPEAAP
jgi:hypothetical protein